MKLKVKDTKPKIPCVDDLLPGQLFFDTHGCVNLVVSGHGCENTLIYWDGGNPHLASEEIMEETRVERLLNLEDLEFTN